MSRFQDQLASLLNTQCQESGSNTPDFILANYLINCLRAFEIASNQRDNWYNMSPQPGWTPGLDVPDVPCEPPVDAA